MLTCFAAYLRSTQYRHYPIEQGKGRMIGLLQDSPRLSTIFGQNYFVFGCQNLL